MNDRYHGSWLKIERAKEHIENANSILKAFLNSNFYRLFTEHDLDGTNFLKCEIDESKFARDRCALIIGDALHNLRSALDLFFYASCLNPGKWSLFPITNTREELVRALNIRIKKEQITPTLSEFILNSVRPYHAGDDGTFFIPFLHYLNNWDKHQLLIPVIQSVEFHEVGFDDEEYHTVKRNAIFYTPYTCRFRLDGTEGRTLTLKYNGHPAAQIFFNFADAPMQNQSVIPTLTWIAEEVTRTIQAFELIGS